MHADHQMTKARQLAELAKAEAKALNEHYMQPDGMDDMGDYFEKLDASTIDQRLAAGCLQAQGVRHG